MLEHVEDAELESGKLEQRRVNLQDLIESRQQAFEDLQEESKEREDLIEKAKPLYGLATDKRFVAQACMEIH